MRTTVKTLGLTYTSLATVKKTQAILFCAMGCLPRPNIWIFKPIKLKKNRRRERTIGLWLDSCYSGAFLIRLAIAAYEQYVGFRLDEGLASCLPDEDCFEMDILKHGVFTYTRLNQGNATVDTDRFNRAILENDKEEIAKGLQGLVSTMSSSTAFLTQGRQFSMSLYKRMIDVHGGFASAELEDKSDFQEVVDELTRFKHSVTPMS